MSGNLKQNLTNVKLGENVQIFDFVNLYDCEIGDNSKVGTFVEIQKGTKIGSNVKIASAGFFPRAGGFGAAVDNVGRIASIAAHENVLNRMSAPAGKEAPTPERAWPTDTYFDEFYKLSSYFNGEAVIVYFEPQGEKATRVRGVSMGFGNDDESRKMRQFFNRGNAYTLQRFQKRFAPKIGAK